MWCAVFLRLAGDRTGVVLPFEEFEVAVYRADWTRRDETIRAALARLGIGRPDPSPGPLARFFTWIGLRSAPPAGPGMLTTAVLRMPDDRIVDPSECSCPVDDEVGFEGLAALQALQEGIPQELSKLLEQARQAIEAGSLIINKPCHFG